jgi:hypothetical protein
LSGINNAGFGLVQRKIETIQHLPYRGELLSNLVYGVVDLG